MFPTIPALLVAAGSCLILAQATAAPISFDFSTNQYGLNFQERLGAASMEYDSLNRNVLYTAATAGGTSAAIYDTDPADTAFNNANFLTETISLDVSFSSYAGTGGPSAGIYGRVQQSSGNGILGLVNVMGNDSTIRIRLFQGAQTHTTAAGTAFFDATFDLATGMVTSTTGPNSGIGSTNRVSLDSPITLTLTQTAGADPVFNFSVSNANGLVASSGNVPFTANDNYNTAGAIGVRFNQLTTGETIRLDNFQVIPEPASAVLTLIGAAALAARRRRLA